MSIISHINDKKIIQQPYQYVYSLDTENYNNGDTYVWVLGRHDIKSDFIEYKVYYDAQVVHDILFNREHRNTVLTGSNLLYDLNTLPLKQTVVEQGGNLIFLKKEGYNNIKIIELQNFFSNSLKDLCKQFKIEGHIDNHLIEHFYYLGKQKAHEIMIQACISHVKSGIMVFRKYESLMLEHLNCKVDITPARTAFGLYKRNYMPKDLNFIDKKHDNVIKMKELTGLSYYGGRTENFVKGSFNDVSALDINSSYPGQMVNEKFPKFNQYDIYKKITIEQFLIYLKENEGSAECKFFVPEHLITILPIIKDQKLCFPTGYIEGFWTYPEIREAIKEGYKLLEVKNVVNFPRYKGKMFDDFINTCYKLKLKPETKTVGKIMMNSSYGKFAQREPDEKGWIVLDPDKYTVEELRSFDNNKLGFLNDIPYEYISTSKIEKVRPFKSQSQPIIAAYITAYGRLQLYRTMKAIGFENVLYCDTDSIHAYHSAIDKANIPIDNEELGKWSFDYQHARLEVRGLKYYRYHEVGKLWVYKIKGVGYTFKRQYWQDKRVLIERFRKRNSAIRFNVPVNYIYNILRCDRNPQDKREFEGKYSRPLYIEEMQYG